jgi:predicted O-linked N-acetylglucosamine transferase (SPINDLY family)
LKGYTQDCRPGILGHRPAPLQVNYLGFPGTMGAEHIQYVIGDAVVIPPGHEAFYTERVVRLPDCYQPNDRQRAIAQQTPTRAELGLPAQGFVFCCFNNNYKITPEVFGVWMDLLRQVPGSVLWLLESNAESAGNLRREAAARGVDAARLVFTPHATLPEHLARQRQADLFLDTLPYNAHTTTSDALWAGLPVLTCLGTAFPGRVAASLLHACGLGDMVTPDLPSYATAALRFARDPQALKEVRERLARNRLTTPLFDTQRLRANLETAYLEMQRRQQAGLPPEGFSV